MCGRENSRVAHHLIYLHRAMIGRNIDSIVTVCDWCHREVEFNDDESKKTLWEASCESQKRLIYTPNRLFLEPDQKDRDILDGKYKKSRKQRRKDMVASKLLKVKQDKEMREFNKKTLDRKWASALCRMTKDA